MDETEFRQLLAKVNKQWTQYSKKKYKYNTKTIEDQINQLRQDLNDLVEVLGCMADGYTELYILITKMKSELGM